MGMYPTGRWGYTFPPLEAALCFPCVSPAQPCACTLQSHVIEVSTVSRQGKRIWRNWQKSFNYISTLDSQAKSLRSESEDVEPQLQQEIPASWIADDSNADTADVNEPAPTVDESNFNTPQAPQSESSRAETMTTRSVHFEPRIKSEGHRKICSIVLPVLLCVMKDERFCRAGPRDQVREACYRLPYLCLALFFIIFCSICNTF